MLDLIWRLHYAWIVAIVVSVTYPSYSHAFDFSHPECEFSVNFPFRPSVKKVVHPLGNNIYSNTFMATATDKRSGLVYTAQCDTSFRLVRGITESQKRKMAEWSINSWSKMINLKKTQMFWEEQSNQLTLRMIGQRVLVEAGKKLGLSFQVRMYIGQRSTMMVGVGEPTELSPSANMMQFLNHSIQFN